MGQREEVLSHYNQHKHKSRDECIGVACDLETQGYSAILAAHMLLILSSERVFQDNNEATMGFAKHSEWMTEKARRCTEDDFNYYEALDARDEVLNAGEILTADLYNFVACFTEEELKYVGI